MCILTFPFFLEFPPTIPPQTFFITQKTIIFSIRTFIWFPLFFFFFAPPPRFSRFFIYQMFTQRLKKLLYSLSRARSFYIFFP